MNSTNTQPKIQEPFLEDDLKADMLKDDINSLVNSLSGVECNSGILLLSSGYSSFTQTHFPKSNQKEQKVGTVKKPIVRGITELEIRGRMNTHDSHILFCPHCDCQLVKNGKGHTVALQHVPVGNKPLRLIVDKQRYACSNSDCTYFYDEPIDFKAEDHFITSALESHILDLLKLGNTAKQISLLCNVSKNTVKDIHKKYLQEKYTVNGEGKELKKPLETCKHLGIDEFLLHRGHKYATVIMDLDTNHVLYLAHGKRKQVVYDFIEWVGMDWMKSVEAVACDMNSDFEQAFREKCSWIKIVFDYFHIVKNFNDKVVSEVRKDIQRQMEQSGDKDGAKALKKTKYILTSSRETLKKKEKDAEEGKVISRGASLFEKPEVKQRSGLLKEYEELLQKNELLLLLDVIKEELKEAYSTTSTTEMETHINKIIRMCRETENRHFEWFARLLENHIHGIITHAELHISSGRVEGFNNMIKTIRRHGFGYPDDDYFFLLIMDASRKDEHWS